jgi:uncharacterized protein
MKFVQLSEQIVSFFMHYKRAAYQKVLERLQEPRKTLQVLSGPRQVGKTTLIKQVLKSISIPHHYASADRPSIEGEAWVHQQWQIGRSLLQASSKGKALLVLDEVQKISHWSEVIKTLWDEDSFKDNQLQVILLGSSPLLMQKGLSESLAGRFELIPMTHWTYAEMREAFDWSLPQYIYFGGYPGAASYIHNEQRWKDYILDALIETSISRDILLMARVDKPALLRRLFHLACVYSGQIFSYQKMLGQLQDTGNVTTLAYYLDLLSSAGMVAGLQKYAGKEIRKKASSPKLQVLNTALITAQSHLSFKKAQEDLTYWGRLTESAVGAYLMNESQSQRYCIFYWRERNREVDFVLKQDNHLLGIEVKSGAAKDGIPGSAQFLKAFPNAQLFLIGHSGVDLEDFFLSPISKWLF